MLKDDRVATPQEKNEFAVQMAIDRQVKKGFLKFFRVGKNGKKEYRLTKKGRKYFQKRFGLTIM